MSRRTVKKTYNLPPDLVERARKILNVRTETEAIVRSLEEVAREHEIRRAVRRVGGKHPDFQPLR